MRLDHFCRLQRNDDPGRETLRTHTNTRGVQDLDADAANDGRTRATTGRNKNPSPNTPAVYLRIICSRPLARYLLIRGQPSRPVLTGARCFSARPNNRAHATRLCARLPPSAILSRASRALRRRARYDYLFILI